MKRFLILDKLGAFVNNYLEFEPSLVKPKIKALFERFKSWDKDPETYEYNCILFTKFEENWREWDGISE